MLKNEFELLKMTQKYIWSFEHKCHRQTDIVTYRVACPQLKINTIVLDSFGIAKTVGHLSRLWS